MLSGKHNFEGCKIEVPSEFNLARWEQYLRDYSDPQVTVFLRYGWPTNSTLQPHQVKNGNTQNHRGARDFPDQVALQLQAEVDMRWVLGPLNRSPFSQPVKISPLNSTEKKDSIERWLILDLSFPPGESVNDFIEKNSYLGHDINLRYSSVDDFSKLIQEKGRNCKMFKRDLRKAYRQIPVDPGDVWLLGFKWNGSLYLDRMLTMGLRSAAYICQRTMSAVAYIYRNMGFSVVVYLDDYAGTESPDRADQAFEALGLLFKDLGIAESPAKAENPRVELCFLGVWFNSESMTMEVKPERLCQITAELEKWLHRDSACRKEVESLVGQLSFVSKCVRPSRAFMARIYNTLRDMPHTGQVTIPQECKEDLEWWHKFLPKYNGVSLIPQTHWSEIDSIIASDACISGCGAVNHLRQEFFHCEFRDMVNIEGLHINELELLTLMAAIKLWGATLKGQRFRIHCDNMVAVNVMNNTRSRNRFMQACMREIAYWAAIEQFEVRVEHIEGSENRLPDALSRWHLGQGYREIITPLINAGWAEKSPDPQIFSFTACWL